MRVIYFCLVVFFALLACNEVTRDMKTEIRHIDNIKSLSDINDSLWIQLAKKTIYFGHQSVGFNILDGIKIIQEHHTEISLNIKYYNVKTVITDSVFLNSRIGQNKHPYSKIQDFEKIIKSELGSECDMAFFKFCYVDFQGGINPETLFLEYKNTLNRLIQEYPEVKFLHITTPLRVKEKGIKGIINKLRGKNRNKQRYIYNNLLLNEYGEENVFDLAYFESLRPDGSHEYERKNTYALVPEYSHDGSHLNEIGKQIIAEQFLIFLAQKTSN